MPPGQVSVLLPRGSLEPPPLASVCIPDRVPGCDGHRAAAWVLCLQESRLGTRTASVAGLSQDAVPPISLLCHSIPFPVLNFSKQSYYTHFSCSRHAQSITASGGRENSNDLKFPHLYCCNKYLTDLLTSRLGLLELVL